MEESVGDNIIWILLGLFVIAIAGGWLLVISITILQSIFQKSSDRLEVFLQKNIKTY